MILIVIASIATVPFNKCNITKLLFVPTEAIPNNLEFIEQKLLHPGSPVEQCRSFLMKLKFQVERSSEPKPVGRPLPRPVASRIPPREMHLQSVVLSASVSYP